jgi:hypothetical protein
MRVLLLAIVLFCPLLGSAQLALTVSPVKITGSKAVVPLTMKNSFAEKIESARATLFLLDEHDKVIGQTARWVIGGTKDKPPLLPNQTTAFNFVVPIQKSAALANLQAKVTFTRIILGGGKLADVKQGVEFIKN